MENTSPAKTVSRLTTLQEHRALLRHVLTTAKNKVLIVSPFIADAALRADRIPGLVSSASRRGVCVDVYTDDKLNKEDGFFKKGASIGMGNLIRSGAHVHIVNGIHNKTLARDEDLIAEGSFNWLSAVRARGAEMQREERTLVVEGGETIGMIKKESAFLTKAAIGQASLVQHDPTMEPTAAPFKKNIWSKILFIGVLVSLIFMATGTKGVMALVAISAFIYALDFLGKRLIKNSDIVTPDTKDAILRCNNLRSDSDDISCSSGTNQDYYWYYDSHN